MTFIAKSKYTFLCIVGLATAQRSLACAVYQDLLFPSQTALETFFADAPCPIDSIMGDVLVSQNVYNLDPFLGLRFIGGSFTIYGGRSLRTLRGLDSLRVVDDGITIQAGSLTELRGLQNLESVSGNTFGPLTGTSPQRGGLFIQGGSPLQSLAFLDHAVDFNGTRVSLQISGLVDASALALWSNYSELDVSESRSLKALPDLPQARNVKSIRFWRCDSLRNLTLSRLDTVAALEIDDCDQLESLDLPSGVTLGYPKAYEPEFEAARTARVYINARSLRTLNMSFAADTTLREMRFELHAPVQSLPDLAGYDFHELILDGPQVDGLLNLSGPRRHTSVLADSILWITDMPYVDSLLVPSSTGVLIVSEVDELVHLNSNDPSVSYAALLFGGAPLIEEIHLLSNLTKVDPYYFDDWITPHLSLGGLASFSFDESDLHRLRLAGGLFFQDLPSNTALPRFDNLDTAFSVSLEDVALPRDAELFRPGRTATPRGVGVGYRYDSTSTTEPTHLRINTTSRQIGRIGRYATFPGGQPRSSTVAISTGIYPDYRGLPLTVTGFDDLEYASSLVLAGRGPDSPPLPAEFAPQLTRVGELILISDEERLTVPTSIEQMQPNGTAETSLTMWSWSRPSPLRDVSALCPLVRSGTIDDYDLDEDRLPEAFNTRARLLTYCDTVTTSAAEAAAWRSVGVHPTLQRAGGMIAISGLTQLPPGTLTYRLVDPAGRSAATGTLVGGSGAGSRSALVPLPQDLTPGQYWLHIDGQLPGQRATGVVVVQTARP